MNGPGGGGGGGKMTEDKEEIPGSGRSMHGYNLTYSKL